MNDIRQFDNITHTVADDLKVQLGKGGKVSVAAACFSIYAFEALKKELEGIEEFRFLFTSPAFTKEFSTKQKREFFITKLQRERTLYGSEFESKIDNNNTVPATVSGTTMTINNTNWQIVSNGTEAFLAGEKLRIINLVDNPEFVNSCIEEFLVDL